MSRTVTALALALAVTLGTWGTAQADPDDRLAGRWKEGALFGRSVDVALERDGAVWRDEVLSPSRRTPTRLTLRFRAGAWELLVEHREQDTVGAAGVLAGRVAPDTWRWGSPRVVRLEVRDGRLEGDGFRLALPTGAPVDADAPPTPGPAGRPDPGALGQPSTSDLPVVRVLITGFDRFPKLRNHPNWVTWDGAVIDRQPSVNPSGWVVRNFDLARVSSTVRRRARIELHRLVDVPVEYVAGPKLVTDTIAEVDADVCISMGVGSDGNVDADVESECRNVMQDGGGFGSDDGEGPFQLPASWPPRGERSSWSAADQAWSNRYPDNAGVSMNGKKIEEDGPSRRASSLPVAAIVERVTRAGLEAHDGRGGPGTYVCNNVMFEVCRVQAARGRLGGFVHLAQWDEAKRDAYHQVVAAAIEASVQAVLDARGARP